MALIITNVALFFSLIHDAFENNVYDLSLFTIFVGYNLSVSMVIIGILVFKFIAWLKSNRNISIFLYGLALAIFFLTTTSAMSTLLLYAASVLPTSVSPGPNPWDRTSTLHTVSSELYNTSLIVVFGLFWLSTALILRDYSLKYTRGIGRKKYWILISLPLVYFIVSSDFVLNQLTAIIFQYPYLSNLFVYIFGMTINVGGLFFAISFILMSKNTFNKSLKVFLAFSAAGIMMLFSSLQISVLQLLPYPPFGLVTLSIMPLSSYLLLIGLYYSALSIAYDNKILSSLKDRIRGEPAAFLSGIGSAEWSRNIENTVNEIMKRTEEPARQSDSDLSSEDIQRYILEVIEEVKQKK